MMTGAAPLLASRVASAVTKLGCLGSDMMRSTDGRDYLNDRGAELPQAVIIMKGV